MNQQTKHPSLWKNREYKLWLTGDLALDIGSSIGSFAFPLITLAVTGSPQAAGSVAFFQAIGLILAILPGGVLADRYDRRKLRLTSCSLGVLAQALFLFLLFGGQANLWSLAVVAAADRFRSSLLGEASDAMIKTVVGEQQLPKAIAINQGREAAVGLGSGPAGGALLALGFAFPPLTQLLGNLLGLLTTLGMKGKYRPDTEAVETSSLKQDFLAGIGWLLARPLLMVIGFSLALLNFGISGAIMTVSLGAAQAEVAPVYIGCVLAALSASMLLGSIPAARIIETTSAGRLLIFAFFLFALLIFSLPLLPNLWWVGAALVLGGFIVPAVNSGLLGFFTLIIPNHMLGRVQSVVALLATGLAALAPALAGWLLGYAGQGVAVAVFGSAALLAGVLLVLSRQVRCLPASGNWQTYAHDEELI
ncbi:MAG: MFS transporter [Rothia sp. (in: high G+C Gram-positive bacteria)]|nr:MFS transporter [Rothia sp. (in: high G+C Gram-positive bacteria)]